MPYEIIAFLVGLGIIIFLKYGKGSLSGLTKFWPGSGNGESGEKSGFFKNFFAEVTEAEKSNFRKWREREKSEKDLWEMYAATAVLGILVAWLTPDTYSEYRYAAAAVAVLLMLHLVVWPFFTKRTSTISKVVLTGIIIFYPAAWLIPAPKGGSGFADGVSATWRIVKKAGQNGSAAMVRAADDYEKGITSGASQSVEQTAVAKAGVTSVQLTIPVDETVVVAPPQGYRLLSALCPPENVMELTNEREGEVPRQIDCAGKITLDETELLGKVLAFFQKPGGKQPSTVIVWWKKIS